MLLTIKRTVRMIRFVTLETAIRYMMQKFGAVMAEIIKEDKEVGHEGGNL